MAARYNYDADQSSLTPVYAIVPGFHNPDDDYARALLARDCLAGIVDYQATPPSLNPNDEPIDPRTGQRNFTAAVAAEWGYQLPPSQVPRGVASSTAVTDEIFDAMVVCGDETRARLGLPPDPPLSAVEGAGWDARDASSAVAEAQARWVDCMQPVGVVDLPNNPNDMPSASVGSAAAADQITIPGTGVASERERQVATADVACRESSGYTQAVFDARVGGELEAIAADIEGFEAARVEYERYTEAINEVIQQYGG
jgi:hypothetical protein